MEPLQSAYADGEGGHVAKCVALTFDDGPDKILTPRLLSILKANNVRATFYLVGSRAVQMPEIVRNMHRDNHEIGNHSWDHPELTKISLAAIQRQIAMTDDAIAAITGEIPRTIRPPYGAVDERVLDALPGRLFVMWDVDTLDWRYRIPSRIIRVTTSHVQNQSIVLMHDIHATTIAAVPGIIDELRSIGYTFVTVAELREGRCAR